ncbi:MarP family serine protease [Arthrobacter crystallopoietes]|uniref:Colicin V production protein n=1 Tax=Crystallibacter crystallopoietes TaxID=37928 RepID=A0A1H1EJD7_9MICC|nr:MarP family serine protease [Arthrobacter crystallopoietes]AUI49889.1 serine protease [Arthrobacter crystallopoietes]SDQ88589.1 Colicin V production protein [Arthrobacter crystallopoietes]
MLFGLTILDIVLILILLAYLVGGLRKGFLVTLGGIVGFVLGAIAAFLSVPFVSMWVPDPGWRLTAIIAVAVLLVILGHAMGSGIGRAIRRRLDFPPVRPVDRLLGGAANVAVAALVMSMLAFSISALGVPFVSQQIAGSKVIQTIDSLTPAPVKSWLAQARSIAVQDGIPQVIDGVAPSDPVPVPDAGADTAALNEAAESVVKIAGTAFQCGQNQTGSGFVIAPDRVMTNAHVVASVNEPVVEIPDGRVLPGRVVHFDPVHDIAVLAVEGLDVRPLPVGEELADGTLAAFQGYPAGGPFQSQPATVQGLSTVLVQNIYGADPEELEVYTLAADVEQGNSGGPLLDQDGRIAGLVFAKATDDVPVGYALSLDEIRPVIDNAMVYQETVSAGQCIRK